MIKCEQCDSATVNGVFVHEQGCPDTWRNEVRECRVCGEGFNPKYKLDFYCSSYCFSRQWG